MTRESIRVVPNQRAMKARAKDFPVALPEVQAVNRFSRTDSINSRWSGVK